MEKPLSIGDVAERTGVSVATLRAWEARHRFPTPRRAAGGHRRYDEQDCQQILEVVRARATGLSLEAAVARVRDGAVDRLPSIFARLHHEEQLPTTVFAKRTLLALSRAIEDECCQRAERPILFGSFQRERFYRSSAARWRELARAAEIAVVFARFTSRQSRARLPHELPLSPDAPLLREWAIVCDAENFAVCLSGWERLREGRVPDRERLFEVVWSAEPNHVRAAASVCVALAEASDPKLAARVRARLDERPPASIDAAAKVALVNRMLAYAAA
jgi:DICT domain-containing protein